MIIFETSRCFFSSFFKFNDALILISFLFCSRTLTMKKLHLSDIINSLHLFYTKRGSAFMAFVYFPRIFCFIEMDFLLVASWYVIVYPFLFCTFKSTDANVNWWCRPEFHRILYSYRFSLSWELLMLSFRFTFLHFFSNFITQSLFSAKVNVLF